MLRVFAKRRDPDDSTRSALGIFRKIKMRGPRTSELCVFAGILVGRRGLDGPNRAVSRQVAAGSNLPPLDPPGALSCGKAMDAGNAGLRHLEC